MPVTLTVEDGTALDNANTFVDLAAFKTYCDNRGLAYSLDDEVNKAALVAAADYLRNEERYWWRGQRVRDTQALPWPRTGAVVLYGTGVALAETVVPWAVKDAQCELAYRAISKAIQPDLSRGGGIASVSAGGVSTSFFQNANPETLIMVTQGFLKPYLRRQRDLPMTPFSEIDTRGYIDVGQSTLALSDGVESRPSSADTEGE